MNEHITRFIQKQKVTTICCVDPDNNPYCFSCFYAYDPERELLYLKTSNTSNHITFLKNNPAIAGTIQPDKLNVLAIQGLQFTGTAFHANEEYSFAGINYHKKYPFAFAMPGEIWVVQLHYIKMTDNSLGFGKKIIWDKKTEVV